MRIAFLNGTPEESGVEIFKNKIKTNSKAIKIGKGVLRDEKDYPIDFTLKSVGSKIILEKGEGDPDKSFLILGGNMIFSLHPGQCVRIHGQSCSNYQGILRIRDDI